MKLSYILFLLALLPYTLLANIRIITDHYAPFSFEENGKIQGICPETIKGVLAKLNINTKIEIYPWARAYNIALNTPNVMLITILRAPKREDLFKWGTPIVSIEHSIFALNPTKPIKTIDEIRSKQIGTVRSDLAEKFLEDKNFIQGKNLIQVSTYENNVSMLLNRRVDAIVAPTSTILYYAKKRGVTRSELSKIYIFKNLETTIYMAFNNNTSEKIVKKFSKALKDFKKTRKYKQILSKYSL